MDLSRYDCLPEEMLEAGINLDSLGIAAIAWEFLQAISVIEHLYNNGYIILGGDVFGFDSFSIKSTYDNWYYNKTDPNNNLEESKKKAIDYITRYRFANGDNYVYCIVFAHN